MKALSTLLVLILVAGFGLFADAGGPPVKVRPMPMMVEVPPPPPPPPPAPMPVVPMWPRMKGIFGLTVYMTDYRTILSQDGFPKFNFGEAFNWSAKEAVTEFSVGARVPGLAETSFAWVSPVMRSGVGIPTVPLSLGGYTFGPRPADTIKLTTRISAERFFAATPYFTNATFMPSFMCEWWHVRAGISGTPTTATTSQAAVDVQQDFHKVMLGAGLSGETLQRPLRASYKALYVMGGHTEGWLAQADIGYKQDNLMAAIGYKYNARKLSFGNNSYLNVDTNGPYLEFNFIF